MSAPLLSVHDLSVSYGPVRAVRDVSLEVRRDEIVALLGANGAGKSSTMWAIVGLAPRLGGGCPGGGGRGHVRADGRSHPRTKRPAGGACQAVGGGGGPAAGIFA